MSFLASKWFITFSLIFLASNLMANISGYSERAAWGGNGGWWGTGNFDPNGEHGWPNEVVHCPRYRVHPHCQCQRPRHHVCHRPCHCHCYRAPYHEYKYNESIPGGALYLGIK